MFFGCWVGEYQFQEESNLDGRALSRNPGGGTDLRSDLGDALPNNGEAHDSHPGDERQSECEEGDKDSEDYSQVEVSVRQGDIDALYRIMASLDIQVGTDAPSQRSRKKKKKKATRTIPRSRSRSRRRKKRRSATTSSSKERTQDVHLGEDPSDLQADPYPEQASPVYGTLEDEDDISLARDLQSWLND